MSKGPGLTQRRLLALMAAQTGPWDLEELCALVYPGCVTPKPVQRGAVRRALRMKLPGKWKVGRVGGWDRRLWLYRDIASVKRRVWAMGTFVVTVPESEELPPSDDGWITLVFDDTPETEIVLTGLPDDDDATA